MARASDYSGGLPSTEETCSIMTDTPPDRLSVNPRSPLYDADILSRGVGIRFNGAEKTNVEEYCISEGWIRVAAGRALDRKGNPITLKLSGTVEPYFERAASAKADPGGDDVAEDGAVEDGGAGGAR